MKPLSETYKELGIAIALAAIYASGIFFGICIGIDCV
jgi:hypothetical protein